MTATARRTSQFTLTVPADPGTDLHDALDALIAAVKTAGVCTGSYFTRPARAGFGCPTLSVAYRAADDDTAAALAYGILAAYGAAEPAQARLHTGYGAHRRDFPIEEERPPFPTTEQGNPHVNAPWEAP